MSTAGARFAGRLLTDERMFYYDRHYERLF